MRPVSKGAAPNVFTAYGQARDDLKTRIGNYCSYCEMTLDNLANVEHVQPKSKVPKLSLSWENFLLACGYCNSTKGNKDIDLDADIFPDLDNPLMAIKVDKVALTIRTDASAEHQAMGAAFLELVGRGRDPDRDSTDRWRARSDTYIVIQETLEDLTHENVTDREKNLAIRVAKGYGHFSMWLSAFDQDSDMKNRLINAFPGTALNCFDQNGIPIHRPGGKM